MICENCKRAQNDKLGRAGECYCHLLRKVSATPTNPPAKHPPSRCPTREELESPLFEAVWQAIKGWDIQRHPGAGYAGANGNDVCTILDSISALLQEERKRAFEEAAKEVDSWLDLLEVDHRDIIAKQQYKDPQEAGREYRNKCNLLGAVRASILKKAQAARSPGDAEKGE